MPKNKMLSKEGTANGSQSKSKAKAKAKAETKMEATPTLVGTPYIPLSPQQVATDSSQTSSERVTWEWDVYATLFVPLQLQAINSEVPQTVTATKSLHRFDYAAYIATFAGTTFLSNRPTNVYEAEHGGIQMSQLTAQSYFRHLTALWELEHAAKKQENEANALYEVQLDSVQSPSMLSQWKLTIPGLRDDNPFLEKGDVLQIRQLYVDIHKNIVQVPIQVKDPGYGHVRLEYKTWTGVQYDSRVVGVHRKPEVVYVEAEGLAPLYAGNTLLPMVVNISFPKKHVALEAQRMALVYISSELKKILLHMLEEANHSYSIPKSTSHKQPPERHNDWILRALFPTEEHGLLQTRLRKVPHREYFDSAVNYEQGHAVNSVCTSDYGTLPYLVSGPPGTGKTKTLVEIAMNLLNSTDVAHVLICAPSEAAADVLARRLKHYMSDKQLLRLNRPERADNEVPGDLLPYYYMENDSFCLPPFRKLMAYNVVVTSCRDAALLADARLTNKDLWDIERNTISFFRPNEPPSAPVLHWGALLIDEAAQATEIDVLPAITVVCPPSTYPESLPQPRFVMAGDENQLGPRTASCDPQFSTSLFARLFDRSLYREHPLSRMNAKPSAGPPGLKKSMLPMIYPPFTSLIRNYRSHPAILSVSSSLFYNDTLIPEAPILTSALQQSTFWQGRKWPVLFLPNTANDEIERDGGGWYNMHEARVACSIAKTLVYESKAKQEDICIMSPFAAQVKVLRYLIQSNAYGGLWGVDIGPLQAFQGLEKRIVIICTTRTRSRFLDLDAKKGLGIINQKRKMNVALTRAKEALFVIGSPEVLRQDEHWRQWLAFCWRNGLVSDPAGLWDGEKEDFGEQKIGVLERALIAKEENGKGKERLLGAAATGLDMSTDYEEWAESLREALDEESEEDEGDEEEEEEEEEDDGEQ